MIFPNLEILFTKCAFGTKHYMVRIHRNLVDWSLDVGTLHERNDNSFSQIDTTSEQIIFGCIFNSISCDLLN